MSQHSHIISILILFVTLEAGFSSVQAGSNLMAQWSAWTTWSPCSRPCTFGVTYRTRVCETPDGTGDEMKNTCVGQYKQYQTCNKDKKCHPSTVDIRKQQCEKFNTRLIGGKRYKWEPFYNARSKCELSCRAKGHKFFARLSNIVVDGTTCSENDPYHICVGGKCERVGCDGVLGSDVQFDKCGVCGGNNTTCHIISGIFTRTRLRQGYNHVTRVPKGACNINITEMYSSDNYLALRLTHSRFVVNGNWVLGPSKDVKAAGTEITYRRPDPGDIYNTVEYIYAKGPTNHSLDLLVGVLQGTGSPGYPDSKVIKQTDNRGILYSYTIPMDDQHHADHSKKSHQNQKSGNTKKDPPKLTFKKAPKYVEPEYKAFERNQVESLALGKKYQRDEEDIRRRNREYLEKIRRQRHEARRRQQQQQGKKGGGANYDVDQGGGANGGNNDNKNHGGGANYDDQQQPVAVAPSSGSASGSYSPRTNPYLNKDSRGIPLALNNNNNGIPARHNSGNPGRNVVGGGGTRQTQYIASGNHGYSRTQYPYGPQTGRQGNVNVYGNNNQQQLPSSGYNAQPFQAGGGDGVYQYQRSLTQQSAVGQPGGSQFVGDYYRGTGASRSVYDASRLGNPSYVSGQDQQPQPGINYGARPGQPLQPNPLDVGVAKGGGDSGVSRGSPYINYNQQPVYVPPSYAGQQGVQSFQVVQRSGNDQSYYYNNGVNRGSGTRGDSKPVGYSWKISGFTECSTTCGGGSQDTVIVCVTVDNQAVVTDENCPVNSRPQVRSVTCNKFLCPAAWNAGNWSDCSTSCGPGTKTRGVECQRRLSQEVQISVTASLCQGQRRPDAILSCNQDRPCVRWSIGEWSQCSAECGRGQRTREVVCLDANDRQVAENKCDGQRPKALEICDMGSCEKTWFFTEWSEECSSACGEGHYTRQLHCTASEDRCNSIRKPEGRKICKSDLPCGGKWFTGPWSKCSAQCGEGTIDRDVVCMKKSGRAMAVVGEENCLAEDKPKTQKQCERDPCLSEWYMTEWAECSRSCDTGIQTREAKCLDAEQKQSTDCKPDVKPSVRQSCNTESCDSHRKHKKDSITGSQECEDDFQNCRVVVQARLCQYQYYKNICCNSCKSHDQHHHGDT